MIHRMRLFLIIFSVCVVANTARPAVDLSKLPPAATRPVDFAKDVQPIFTAHCYTCHGEKKQEAAFRLDDKAIAFKGGELGVAIDIY